ncbi:MAG: SIR2 family protein [Acidobacteriota bacterium]|nr:SIR2 family protein [Acidobacteriota bacterium]
MPPGIKSWASSAPTPNRQEEERHIRHLHGVYQAGKLRILIGAGTSIDSGLPSWEVLSLNLLNGWIQNMEEEREEQKSEEERKAAASLLHAALGRDGATDFIAARVSRHDFRELLADALYGTHNLCDFRPRSVHKQLAVMSNKASLYTTNYDPLIELALEELQENTRGTGWRKYRDPAGHTYSSVEKCWHSPVHHLHGWIDPSSEASGPEYGGSFVITESHYLELPNNPDALANRRMQELLETEGATLILGMSMEDPNVRRMLYRLSRSALDPIADLYVVLKYERKEDRLINEYVVQRWEQRKVTLISINDYDDLPSLLRRIHWGMPGKDTPPERWLPASISWIQEQLNGDQFTDDWQTAAHQILEAFCKTIKCSMKLRDDEIITSTLFVPMQFGPSVYILAPLASTRRKQTGDDAREYVGRKNIPLQGPGKLGAISASFLLGKPRAARGADTVASDFPEAPGDPDDEYFRNRRSLLAVPVLDSADWLPVAVIVITSSREDLKWDEFLQENCDRQRWFFSSLRKTADLLIRRHGSPSPEQL